MTEKEVEQIGYPELLHWIATLAEEYGDDKTTEIFECFDGIYKQLQKADPTVREGVIKLLFSIKDRIENKAK